jgi:hypothetical protein
LPFWCQVQKGINAVNFPKKCKGDVEVMVPCINEFDVEKPRVSLGTWSKNDGFNIGFAHLY